jgi:hypothetical protein
VIPLCRLPVVLHDLCKLQRMHVEVIKLHDGVMIAECCLSDAVARIALSFGACYVITIRNQDELYLQY